VVGKPKPRLDTPEKVTGSLRYGADLKLPGMLHAAIHACPVHGGTRKRFDATRAKTMPGVRRVLEVGDDAVAVVADSWWQAKTALDTIAIDWDTGGVGDVNSDGIRAMIREGLSADDVFVGNQAGDARGALANAANTVTAEYSFPLQSHAPMEPMNTTAIWREDRCEAWVPTQNGESALEAVASAAGLFPEQCEVHKTILGGGFGRRGMHDFAIQAVQIAKQIPGTPIKLLWSREEDQRRGYYHPLTYARMSAALSDEGDLEALHIRLSGISILASLRPPLEAETLDPFVFQSLGPDGPGSQADHKGIYGVPHLLVDHAMRNIHLRPGFWRGVNANQNVFYIESFMDELAAKAGRDPLEFRRSLLAEEPRARAVLDTVARKAGYGSREPARGQRPGPGRVQVLRQLRRRLCRGGRRGRQAAHEEDLGGDGPGLRGQPAAGRGAGVRLLRLRALRARCTSEMTVENGAIVEENFDSYPSMRLAADARGGRDGDALRRFLGRCG
jgi:isoquinoline 1-oxidoreductase beta subunit